MITHDFVSDYVQAQDLDDQAFLQAQVAQGFVVLLNQREVFQRLFPIEVVENKLVLEQCFLREVSQDLKRVEQFLYDFLFLAL